MFYVVAKTVLECEAYVMCFVDLMCSVIRNKLSDQGDYCYTQKVPVSTIYNVIEQMKNFNKK